jgi:hypothetical protein
MRVCPLFSKEPWETQKSPSTVLKRDQQVLASLHAGVRPHEWAYTHETLRTAFNGAELEVRYEKGLLVKYF